MEHIKNFIQHCVAVGLAQTTIDSYCYALKDYWQYLMRNKVEVVTDAVIENYFIYLRGKKYSPTTIRDKYSVLHAYYEYCVKQGYYTKSPVQIKKPKANQQIRVFTDDEILKMMQYFKNRETFTQIRDYTIICILLSTGIRRSELLGITNISDNAFIVVGKGNKQRVVPISNTLKTVLKEYLPIRNKIACCPNLIITKTGTPLTKNGLRAVFTRLSNACGIDGRRFCHSFRHYYATKSLASGMDLQTLSHILGHSNISTTALYLHYSDVTAQKINDRTNPLNIFLKIF